MPPEVVADKAGASPASSTVTPPAGLNITSGTASEALIKAASSAEAATQSAPVAKPAGDTPPAGGDKTTPVTTTAATELPKVEGQPDESAGKGEAPEARIQTAVKNARTNLLTQFGQAIGLTDANGRARAVSTSDVEDIRIGMNLLRDLRTDARGFGTRLFQELGIELPQPKTEDYTFPKASLKSDDGQEAYSAGDIGKIAEILERKITAKLLGEVEPLRNAELSRAEQIQETQRRTESREMAGTVLTQMRNRPHFKENEPAVKARVAELLEADPQLHLRIGAVAVMQQAFQDVLETKVYPTLGQEAERKVREDNQRQAAGSTLVHPAVGAGDGKKVEITNVTQLAKRMEDMASGKVPMPSV